MHDAQHSVFTSHLYQFDTPSRPFYAVQPSSKAQRGIRQSDLGASDSQESATPDCLPYEHISYTRHLK